MSKKKPGRGTPSTPPKPATPPPELTTNAGEGPRVTKHSDDSHKPDQTAPKVYPKGESKPVKESHDPK